MNTYFECYSAYNVLWYYEDSTTIIGTGNVLEISNITRNVQGTYVCQGMDVYGDNFRANGTLIVVSKLYELFGGVLSNCSWFILFKFYL